MYICICEMYIRYMHIFPGFIKWFVSRLYPDHCYNKQYWNSLQNVFVNNCFVLTKIYESTILDNCWMIQITNCVFYFSFSWFEIVFQKITIYENNCFAPESLWGFDFINHITSMRTFSWERLCNASSIITGLLYLTEWYVYLSVTFLSSPWL